MEKGEVCTTFVETTSQDLFLNGEERYEIWIVKTSERPELLDHYCESSSSNSIRLCYDDNDHNEDIMKRQEDIVVEEKKEDNDDIETSKSSQIDKNNNNNDNHDLNVFSNNDEIQVSKLVDISLCTDNNNIDDSINQQQIILPISDGCDIPGWRQYNLVTNLKNGNNADDIQTIFHIGQGSTLLRLESQLPLLTTIHRSNRWKELQQRFLHPNHYNTKQNIKRISYRIDPTINGITDSSNKPATLPKHSWFERDNIPVLIEGCCTDWDSMTTCTFNKLVERFGHMPWRFSDTHSETMSLNTYQKYMNSYDSGYCDDAPLAIYDSQFGNDNDERSIILKEYTIPSCFRDCDLYEYLPSEDVRPPYRWILIGPERSGTGLHIDPVGTHAWVTLVEGCKKWILFPYGTNLKSIHMQGNLQIPSAIWFYKYYDTIIKQHPNAIEVIQYPGETVYVPAGWPHLVLNLKLSVAITQNYATEYPSMERLYHSIIHNDQEMELSKCFQDALKIHRPDLV